MLMRRRCRSLAAGNGVAARRHRPVGRYTCIFLVAVAACGSPTIPITPPAPAPAPETIEHTVFLVGDAGAAAPGADPVLEALAAELSSRPSASTVVYLGDNIYPRGMPDSASPLRREAERRIAAQADVVADAGARGIFVPGNHDWAAGGRDGWDAVLRQERFIADRAMANLVMLPGGGCPGPAVIDIGERLRLVILDTQWWLQSEPKPMHPTSSCATDSPAEVTDSLRGALRSAGDRYVGVIAHHPLLSGGLHGGHFGLLDHIFPLRVLKSWLWIPLPALGSAYPLARASGISSQDLSGRLNREMRDSLTVALAVRPPLFFASGHEHNLQVLDGLSARHLLISGVGYFGHTSRVVYLEQSRYAAAKSGYMRVELVRDGRVRLAVLVVDAEAQVSESFSMWLAAR